MYWRKYSKYGPPNHIIFIDLNITTTNYQCLQVSKGNSNRCLIKKQWNITTTTKTQTFNFNKIAWEHRGLLVCPPPSLPSHLTLTSLCSCCRKYSSSKTFHNSSKTLFFSLAFLYQILNERKLIYFPGKLRSQ